MRRLHPDLILEGARSAWKDLTGLHLVGELRGKARDGGELTVDLRCDIDDECGLWRILPEAGGVKHLGGSKGLARRTEALEPREEARVVHELGSGSMIGVTTVAPMGHYHSRAELANDTGNYGTRLRGVPQGRIGEPGVPSGREAHQRRGRLGLGGPKLCRPLASPLATGKVEDTHAFALVRSADQGATDAQFGVIRVSEGSENVEGFVWHGSLVPEGPNRVHMGCAICGKQPE